MKALPAKRFVAALYKRTRNRRAGEQLRCGSRSGKGRSYPMSRIVAVFKADEVESESRYSISE